MLKEAVVSRIKICAGCSAVVEKGKFCESCKPKRTISVAELFPNELKILEMISRGLKSKDIAEEMGLTNLQVDNRINTICIKLGITSVGDTGVKTLGNRRVAIALAWLEYKAAEELKKRKGEE